MLIARKQNFIIFLSRLWTRIAPFSSLGSAVAAKAWLAGQLLTPNTCIFSAICLSFFPLPPLPPSFYIFLKKGSRGSGNTSTIFFQKDVFYFQGQGKKSLDKIPYWNSTNFKKRTASRDGLLFLYLTKFKLKDKTYILGQSTHTTLLNNIIICLLVNKFLIFLSQWHSSYFEKILSLLREHIFILLKIIYLSLYIYIYI